MEKYKYIDFCQYGTQGADPFKSYDLSEFDYNDIDEMIAEGETAEGEIFYGRLKDGRYFVHVFEADYTFDWGHTYISDSRFEIERLGMTKEEREYLGL